MLSTALPASAALYPPRPVISRPARPRVQLGRWQTLLSYAGVAALIIAMIGGLAFTYRSRHETPVNQAAPSPAASPAATPAHAWPTVLANNQRTATTTDPGPTGAFITLWSFAAPSGLNNVVVAGDAAFLQSEDGTLYCLDRATGRQRWAMDTGGPAGGNTLSYPAVDGGTVYAAGRKGDVFALDVASGAVKWKQHLSDNPIEASLLVQDGVVYTGDAVGLFVALNESDGSERWRFNDGQGFQNTFPALADGVIYVGGPKSVRAINAATGKLVWEARTNGQVRGAAVDHGVVYAPTGAGAVVALAAADGRQMWSQAFPGVGPALSVAVSGATVAAGFDAGGIVGLDAATGKTLWRTADSSGQTTASKVSIADGIVYAYFGPRKGILALDLATGRERGFGATAEVRMPPSIVDGVLYAGSGAGRIAYALKGVDAIAAAAATSSPPPPATPTDVTAAAWASPASIWTVTGGAQPFQHSADVAIDPHGDLWVADASSQFQIFDLDGTYLETWGSAGSGDGQFNFVRTNGDVYGGVVFAKDGSFDVVDTRNLRVQQFDKDRRFVKAWGGHGSGDGQFLDPLSIAIDGQGRLYVLDDLRDDVQVFASDGTFVRKFRVHQSFGISAGLASSSNDLSIDGAGHVYVSSALRSAVLEFDASGTLLAEIGGPGDGHGRFRQPTGIAFDGAGNRFVADIDNNRIEVFGPDGRFLAEWGQPGPAGPGLAGPVGLAIRGPFVYVAELVGSQVEKFKIVGPFPAPATTPAP